MKHLGTVCEFVDERNNDLMRAYRDCIASANYLSMDEIFAQVASSPSVRFWVSESRASVVVSEIDRGVANLEKMTPMKREMYKEIYRRITEIRKTEPKITITDAVFRVVNSPAPKFYLTAGSTQVIIGRVKKKWYENKMKKLRSAH